MSVTVLWMEQKPEQGCTGNGKNKKGIRKTGHPPRPTGQKKRTMRFPEGKAWSARYRAD